MAAPPICECGAGACRGVPLPEAAWEAAGAGGIGKGPGGADVYAVAAGHVRAYHDVVATHDGWVAVLERAAA